MTTRFSVALDGVPIESIDPSIAVLDVQEDTPETNLRTLRRAGGGLCVLAHTRDSLSVTIQLVIRSRSLLHRAQALEALVRWCQGRVLTAGHRPGRMLAVRCTGLPAAGSAQCWTDTLTIAFTAFDIPYWQEERSVQTQLTGNGETQGTLYVPGTAPDCPAEVRLSLTSSAPADGVSIRCGDTQLTLTGLALASGETLHIRWDEADRLQAVILAADGAQRSALACLAASSNDRLLLRCGQMNSITISASGASFHATVQARGRYL